VVRRFAAAGSVKGWRLARQIAGGRLGKELAGGSAKSWREARQRAGGRLGKG
jgi:hypothetical protein